MKKLKIKNTGSNNVVFDGDLYGDGYIYSSLANMVKVFGEPEENTDPDDHKVTLEWFLELSDGSVCTIHNWDTGARFDPEYDDPEDEDEYETLEEEMSAENYAFHVGGLDPTVNNPDVVSPLVAKLTSLMDDYVETLPLDSRPDRRSPQDMWADHCVLLDAGYKGYPEEIKNLSLIAELKKQNK